MAMIDNDIHTLAYCINPRIKMKKIEFDFSQGRFLIETDEPSNDAFIKEYSDILTVILALNTGEC